MKIVNRAQFLALPPNTLFSKYSPCFFGELEIKGQTWGDCNDFLSQQVSDAIACTGSEDFSNKLEDAQESGDSLAMDFQCMGRDGCFDADQLFAVWEPADVAALIERLKPCCGAGIQEYGSEPIIHAGIEDCLPEGHPLAHETVRCEACDEQVHASNNETMQPWVEGGLGAFCLACFGSDPGNAVMHALPARDPAECAEFRDAVVSTMRQARGLGRL